jgi:hypothetical protein
VRRGFVERHTSKDTLEDIKVDLRKIFCEDVNG